jgi:nucleoside-diphosphate-sugar epimerase
MSSYGVQKLCSEYLIGDYDRRGLVDGRSLRFPTIAVRPGKANLANSSFISAVIREPVAGRATVCPVPDDVPIALMSPGRLIEAILKAHDLPTAEFGWPRVLVLPAVQVTVRGMLEALDELAGPEPRKLVSFEPSERIVPMVKSWPAEVFSARTDRLGIKTDTGAREIVADYLGQNSR